MLKFFQDHVSRKDQSMKVEVEEVEDFLGAFEISLKKKDKFEMIHSKLNTGKGVTTENIQEIERKIFN